MVKNLKFAKVAKNADDMRASGKFNMRESIKQIEAPKDDDTMYKLKLLAFVIVSIIMIVYAMTPARKAPAPK